MNGKVAVTPRSLSRAGHPALQALTEAGFDVIFPTPGRQPSVEDLHAFLPECVGMLAGVEHIPGEVLRQCKQLRIISRNGVGVDGIDMEAAAETGIAIERTAGANARGVAELTIALVLAGMRHIAWSDAQLKSGNWARRKGGEVIGKTLGVVGCGHIGQMVVELALGLGMRTVAYDPYPNPDFRPTGAFAYAAFDDLLQQADVVSLHAPAGDQPVISAAAIERMKPGALLVNTARAALVDESAVLHALETGQLMGFATDVFQTEPPEPTALLQHEGVVTTPHIGGYTAESVDRATTGAVANLLKHLLPKQENR